MSTYLSNFFGLWPRNGEAELAKLREEVQGSMEDNGIDHKPFFPAEKINKLVTKNRVAAVLWRKPSDSLVIFVSQHARKMFLALVCGGVCSVNDLECIMLSCQAHGMTDDKLPVPAMACMGRGDGPQKCTLKHGPWLNVYHDSRWKKLKYGFRRDQCVLNAPVFSDRDFRYELTAECVLPFIWKALDERDGHFSSVFEAILHKDHFVTVCEEGKGDGTKLRRVPSREPLRVALKKMKHLNERGYNVGSAWEHEVLALTEIRELRHKHLIRPLAAIKHGLEHYIMFEWAEGGSLRDFWKSEDETDGYLTPERVMCVLEQLLGLAGALAALHNTNTRTSTGLATRAPSLQPAAGSSRTTTSRPDPSQMLQVPGPVPSIHIQRDSSDDESHRNSDIDRSYASEDLDTELEVHWRHGDLKPDNILRFKDHSSQRWLGTLKIADLGLAKQHFDKTSRRDEGTKQRYTTSQYEAPEAIANLDSPRSRRYDIWSMGCIILEFVIVLLYGPDGLTAFYRERELGQASTDTLYFTLDAHNGPVHVSHIAKHWMEQILGNSECRRPEGSAISDLISLVRDRLLIVPLPADNMTEDQKKRCRADASELQRQLERMRGLALKRGDSYLLGEPARQHSSIPFPFSVQGPETRKEGQGYLKAPGPQAPWRELV